MKDKQEISEGYYAVLEDPQKNTIGIWQNKLKKESTFFYLNWKLQEYEFELVSQYVLY